MFNAKERVRLWNGLVFSETYFSYIAKNEKFKRKDIAYILELCEDKSKNIYQ